ncbi:hypothetical protein C5167_021158 [Papaver somniferum]|uniref:Cathepsin propeptide inhibitor domain-containing protein n=1 Tax=Papaver somniferum TaxID=3469 RepID=A0A4Y7IYB5_PAPSO|nr:uncharacterized protein LOC113354491 [Papaver somniferum]RZC52732.1 hypothetical protein C5167_021158 [Papaver somniferum]
MSESLNSLTAGIGMGGRTTYSDKDLKITEDILKSEDELLALYWKWISIYRRKDYDFGNKKFIDLEFEKMFTERFEKFKDTVRMIHTVNNTKGAGWTAGFNHMADFTDNEKRFY